MIRLRHSQLKALRASGFRLSGLLASSSARAAVWTFLLFASSISAWSDLYRVHRRLDKVPTSPPWKSGSPCQADPIDTLVLRVGSLGAGSVGFEGQNQFSQLCSSIFRHRVSSCCSISLFMYFNSNFSTGGTAHGSLESICLDPGVGQKRQAH